MFGLSYLSNENKRELEKINERLAKVTSPQTRNEIELRVQEIMAHAKPYVQCDLVEADELRSQLLNKIKILSGLGKSTEVFGMHLRDVEFHIQTLQMQDLVKEKERLRPQEPPNQLGKLGSKKGKRQKEAFGSRRWQIGFDDEPDDPETQK